MKAYRFAKWVCRQRPEFMITRHSDGTYTVTEGMRVLGNSRRFADAKATAEGRLVQMQYTWSKQ